MERPYQQQAFWARFRSRKALRRYLLSWLRQGGKTRALARMSLREMMQKSGHLVTFVSASLGIGSELIQKQNTTWNELVEKEAMTWKHLLETTLKDDAGQEHRLVATESLDKRGDKFRELGADFRWEDLAEILTSNRFEMKLYHTQTTFSRTKIIAANIATARGWSGSVYLDEAAFVKDLGLLLAEMEPIFKRDPFFAFIMATTPPEDYGHLAYELMTSADDQEEWELNGNGNWYKNKAGMWVHRVTIDDAVLGGLELYDVDDSTRKITPDEDRAQSMNRDGWDRSNRLKRPQVGTNMVSPMAVNTAMAKGKNFVAVEGEISKEQIETVISLLGPGKITLGMDLASTAGKKSNPTALAVVQKAGSNFNVPLVWWWKTSDPNVTERRVKELVAAFRERDFKVESMGIDATNERLFSQRLKGTMRKLFRMLVRLLIKGKQVEYRGEKMSLGALLGHQAKNLFEDSRIAIPNDKYLAADITRKKTDGDGFTAAVGPNGEHSDTMDAIENGLNEQLSHSGKVQAAGAANGSLAKQQSSSGQLRPGLKNPLLRKLADKASRLFRLNS